jgi:hypothetical protein
MTEDEVRKFFQRTLRSDPQKSGQAANALNSVYEGLQSLIRIGYPFVLVPGTGYIPQGWPKMMYSPTYGDRIINSPEEMAYLEGDWTDTPHDSHIPDGNPKLS